MKKLIGLCLFFPYLIFILIACDEPQYEVNINTNPENLNILIAYFSWADNVEEFNPDELVVDSYTGASLQNPGNAEIVADFIHDHVGGVYHKIQVETPYSEIYDDCLDRARTELSNDTRPTLKSSIENFDSYDTIFLGFPNWWNHLPRAVLTFIDSYDFSNKTVIPFCVHGTNGKTTPVNELAEYLPETTTVMESIGVYRPETLSSRPDVDAWLNGLGFVYEA